MLEKVKSLIIRRRLIDKGDNVLLAVSGGPDSMALLHIMYALREELQIRIGAAHLNHRLRPEAETEEAYLRDHCRELKIEFYSRAVDVGRKARQEKKSVEEMGRDLRYRFFAETSKEFHWGKTATAHHKDDRAETVLLRLLRGSGVKGLRSIMPISDHLIRPLLLVSKAEIIKYLNANDIKFFIDQSNSDPIYLRNRVRHELMPLLLTYNPQIVNALNQLADIAEEENLVMEKEIDLLWEQLRISDGRNAIILDNDRLQRLLPAYQRRLVQKALSRLKGDPGWNLKAIEYVLDLSGKTGPARQIDLPQKVRVKREYGKLIFSAARRQPDSFSYEITIPGLIEIKETGESFSFEIVPAQDFLAAPGEVYFDFSKMKQPLFLRSRRAGDRFAPLNMQGTKKLKDYFIDIKLPPDRRDLVPVLASGDEIYGLLGYRMARNAAVDPGTQNILAVKRQYSYGL